MHNVRNSRLLETMTRYNSNTHTYTDTVINTSFEKAETMNGVVKPQMLTQTLLLYW